MEFVFWLAVLLVVYSYLLYPMLLAMAVQLLPPARSCLMPCDRTVERPEVACIVAAFNEEKHIEARIGNFLDQTFEAEKLRIYVGSDGSNDRTGELIAARNSCRVRAFVFDRNRGKASVLNDLVGAASEPILVFSDANTLFEPEAVERLVAHFADPRVGLVCGELKLLDSAGSNQDSAYWRIEQFLKRSEARFGGLLGANGAIYALRRELYRPLASDTITDDFSIAMTVAAEGWTLVYEPKAIAVEDTPVGIADEYRRRVRIGIGNYQALFRHPEFFLRTNWATRFAYFSHKVLRWLTPHLLIVALLAAACLARESEFFFWVLVAQLIGYGAGALCLLGGFERFLPRFVASLLLFLAINWAFLVGFVHFVTGNYNGSWRSTARSSGVSSKSTT